MMTTIATCRQFCGGAAGSALAVALALSSPRAIGAPVTVSSKAEFLAAVAEASGSTGRLTRDLDVVFAAGCEPMVIGDVELWNESAQCMLDCGGCRISLDASGCPGGTVVLGRIDEDASADVRTDAIKGCGKGSAFRNLSVVNHGRIDFASSEDTIVKDCDFINCGKAVESAGDGGALRGCAVVEGCGFERCGARFGGAVSDCGYVGECLFFKCRARDAGGAVAGFGDVFRCEFRDCAADAGGAICGGRDIVSCLFVDCTAGRGGAVVAGEGLDDVNSKIVHSTFIRCTGGADAEAVFESPDGSPFWMLNCLCYGCGLWQKGAREDEKFGCHRLAETGFFRDFDKGDYHPNPKLTESWTDPCGLVFGDSGSGVALFACRDLDGYGYEFTSPWPDCPGCYRFRTVDKGDMSGSDASVRRPGHTAFKPHNSARPGHWRTSPKKSRLPAADFGHSARNRPPRIVSSRSGTCLLDLSVLPCEITQNEILHEGDNLLDFATSWYSNFELCGPFKLPEVGVTPGYGCPGEITPYEEDDELKGLERKYGFRAGWFQRGFPKEGDRGYPGYLKRLQRWDRRTNDVLNCYTCAVEKIPFLFSQAPGKGRNPLVVFIAGSGEQGTDLKKMFRQTGVFDAVREPSFLAGHPCHLLAIMPPEFANRVSYIAYPHPYSGAYGCSCDSAPPAFGPDFVSNPPGCLDLVRMYADLVFALQRELESKGGGMIDPDAIVLVGLSSGSTPAVSMMREYPGRYAGVCATRPSFFTPTANRHRPGRWWFAVSETYHQVDEKIDKMMSVYKDAGAEVRLTYYPDGDSWWNLQFSSPEFKAGLVDCFDKGPLHGEKLVVAPPAPAGELLIATTAPGEATYYGTTEERPEGLPKEVAGKRIADMKGIRYLYIDGGVGAIPPEAFARSPDLETVHFKGNVTNVAPKAFAESPNLRLAVLGRGTARIAPDAFDGCAPSLYGATIGIPVSVSRGFSTGTNGVVTTVETRQIKLDSHALPVEGLFGTHLFICDDELNRRLYVEGDFLWSEEEEGAIALMHLGEGRDVFVPETLGGRPVVAIGRWLLHHGGGFEYENLAIPAPVRKVNLFAHPPKVRRLFAACELNERLGAALAPDSAVYATKPNKDAERLMAVFHDWKGTVNVVPADTDPHEFFASLVRRKQISATYDRKEHQP